MCKLPIDVAAVLKITFNVRIFVSNEIEHEIRQQRIAIVGIRVEQKRPTYGRSERRCVFISRDMKDVRRVARLTNIHATEKLWVDSEYYVRFESLIDANR